MHATRWDDFSEDEMTDAPSRRAGRRRSVLRLLARRPLTSTVWIGWGVLALAAGVNAGFLQDSPHPSPFFADAFATGPAALPLAKPLAVRDPIAQAIQTTAVPQTPDAAPAVQAEDPRDRVRDIQAALAARSLYDGAVDGLFGPRTEAAIRAFERQTGLSETGQPTPGLRDLIMQPARPRPAAARPAAARPAPAPAVPDTSRARILAVQEVLADLGYGPVALDGVLSDSTKTAIEQFEADRGLERSGAVSDGLVRELEEVTGLDLG